MPAVGTWPVKPAEGSGTAARSCRRLAHTKYKLAAEGGQQGGAAGKRRHNRERQRAWAKRPRPLCGGTVQGPQPEGPPPAGPADTIPVLSLSDVLPDGWWSSEDLLPAAWESLSGGDRPSHCCCADAPGLRLLPAAGRSAPRLRLASWGSPLPASSGLSSALSWCPERIPASPCHLHRRGRPDCRGHPDPTTVQSGVPA